MSEDSVKPEGWVEVANVQRITTPGGIVHLYFRMAGYREGPLKSAYGTEALKAEVDAIRNRVKANQDAAKKPRPNTVAGLLKLYMVSADFLTNAASTRKEYSRMIEDMIVDCGDVLLSSVTRSWVLEMRDAWALRGYRAANLRLQMLRNAFAPVVLDETDHRIAGDPFVKIQDVKRPQEYGESHPIWTDDEVKVAIEEAITAGKPGLARAIALGRYGGFRKGSICRIPRHARVTMPDDNGAMEKRLNWITAKRLVMCDKREDPRLTDVLERTPNRALTIAYNFDGGTWKERALSHAVDRHMARLAKQGKVRSAEAEDGTIYCPLDIHGLRHSRGTELARNKASDAHIMAQLEQSTTRSASIYRRQAERRSMADDAQDMLDDRVTDIQHAKAAREERLAKNRSKR